MTKGFILQGMGPFFCKAPGRFVPEDALGYPVSHLDVLSDDRKGRT